MMIDENLACVLIATMSFATAGYLQRSSRILNAPTLSAA
jgi:hypothetical protein